MVKSNFIRKNRNKRGKYINAITIAVLGGLIALFSSIWFALESMSISEKSNINKDLSSLNHLLAKNIVILQINGNDWVLSTIENERDVFSKKLNELNNGWLHEEFKEGVAGLANLKGVWFRTKTDIDSLISNHKTVSLFPEKLLQAKQISTTLKARVLTFIRSYDGILFENERKAFRQLLAIATNIEMYLSKIKNENSTVVAKIDIKREVNDFSAILDRLNNAKAASFRKHQKALDGFRAIREQFITNGAGKTILNIDSLLNKDVENKRLSNKILSNSDFIAKSINNINRNYNSLRDNNNLWLLLVGIGLLILIGSISYRVREKRKAEHYFTENARKENDRNLGSIQKLLNEIEGLGRGELTGQATVDNGFTSGIANVLNGTVLNLKILVSRVRETTNNVAGFAKNTGSISGEVLANTQLQDQAIDKIAEDIGSLAQEIGEAAQKASSATEMAGQALSLSKYGGTVVSDVVTEMNALREITQESAKKIKFLGELSQEIGEVTQLIRRVGSRINVLALNAGIQSAEAGSGGEGFSVIAEEVQSLSDEVASSTTRINDLIKNIQESSKDAILTMEAATSRVVNGARIADSAGRSLKEIGETAESLQKIITEVKKVMQYGSESTTSLSLNMNQVKIFTRKTRENSDSLKKSISEMESATQKLQKSVDGFKID